MDPVLGDTAGRGKALGVLIISQVLYVAFVPVWFLFLAMVAVSFDRRIPEPAWWHWCLFFLIEAYPAGLIAGAGAGWLCFVRGKYRGALRWNLLPLLWVIPIAGILLRANLG